MGKRIEILKETIAKAFNKLRGHTPDVPSSAPIHTTPHNVDVSQPPPINTNHHAYKASQDIKGHAQEVVTNPKSFHDLQQKSLAVFHSKQAGNYAGDVTRDLAHAQKAATDPKTKAALGRLVDVGHETLEKNIVKRTARLSKNPDMADVVARANLDDATALLKSGAKGESRDFALKAFSKNIASLAEHDLPKAKEKLASTVNGQPHLLQELLDATNTNKGARNLITPETVLELAPKGEPLNPAWSRALVHAFKQDFAHDPAKELEFLKKNADRIGDVVDNDVLRKRLAHTAQDMPSPKEALNALAGRKPKETPTFSGGEFTTHAEANGMVDMSRIKPLAPPTEVAPGYTVETLSLKDAAPFFRQQSIPLKPTTP